MGGAAPGRSDQGAGGGQGVSVASHPAQAPCGAERGELATIDAGRFVAALLIVVYHFGHGLTGLLAILDTYFGPLQLCVDFFFVISGFIISYQYADRLTSWRAYLAFLRRRVARLAPLHWLTLLVFVVAGLAWQAGLVPTADPSNYDWRCLPANALALHALGVCRGLSFNFVSWSISAEMAMYVLAPALIALCRRSTALAMALVLVAWTALNLSAGDLRPHPGPAWYRWTSHFGVARAAPEFLLGVILCRRSAWLAALPRPRLMLAGASAAVFALVAMRSPQSLIAPCVYLVAAATLACDVQGRAGARVRRLAAAGQLSYGMYMLHPVVLTLFLTVLGRRVLHLDGAWENAWVGAAVLLTVSLAALSHRHIETPLRNLINGERRPARPADPRPRWRRVPIRA